MEQEKIGSTQHRQFETREFIDMLVREPSSNYFGLVTCDSGAALAIKTSLVNYLYARSVDLSDLADVCCEGTVINTESPIVEF